LKTSDLSSEAAGIASFAKPSVYPVTPSTIFPIAKILLKKLLSICRSSAPTARGSDFLLNITDWLTKAVFPAPCSRSISKHELGDTFLHVILCRYGIPLVLISEGNGQAETTNEEIVSKLKMYCSVYPYHWDQKVFHLAYAYSTTVHTVVGESPFYCLHGYHPSSAYTLYLPSLQGPAPTQGGASEVSRFRRGHALASQSAHSVLPSSAGHVPSPGVEISRLGRDHALTVQKVHSTLEVDAQRRFAATTPPPHRLPQFKVGDHV
jgi:hypothetical protein